MIDTRVVVRTLLVCLLVASTTCVASQLKGAYSLKGIPILPNHLQQSERHVRMVHIFPEVHPKRLCAVESLLRSNRRALAHIYTTNATGFIASYNRTSLSTLHPDRVIVHQTDLKSLFDGTPFVPWYSAEKHQESQWPSQQLGNAARLALLFKNGGTYLDLDFIVLKDLSTLPRNFIAKQDTSTLNNAFLRFEPGHPFLHVLMESFIKEYDGYQWGFQGPYLLTRVMNRTCMDQNVPAADWCKDVTVGGEETVYPFRWEDTGMLLQNGVASLDSAYVSRCKYGYAVHFWNSQWHQHWLEPQSFLSEMLAQHCPLCFPAF